MRLRFSYKYLFAIPVLCVLGIILYNIPFIHSRLSWRIDNLRVRVQYAINPPEQAIFQPQEQAQLENQVDAIVNAKLTALAPTLTPTPLVSTPTQVGPTSTPQPSPTSTLSPTPIPDAVSLAGVKYEDQHNRYNFCGPANLSMALTFWGWDGNRDTVGEYVKTNKDDKNVMPYELQDFVRTQTEDRYGALIRYGGDIDLLKKLVAGGFPVVTEKGYYTYDLTGRYGWLGHYQFVTGYDDAKGVLIVQDTYIPKGENHEFPFAEFNDGWRSFDNLFMVVYPLEREGELLKLLGEYADPDWSSRHALEVATNETSTLTAVDQYFAAFNTGTSHVNLKEYVDAAYAYDYAFQLYSNLPDDDLRPYRMLWYQTGPYFAYYYSGRYQDVIDLANVTFDTVGDDVLEETWYWRGMGELALGQTDAAIADFQESVRLHPDFAPGLSQLEQLVVTP
jgi:tetratricopeptide (TPR) repeat protein